MAKELMEMTKEELIKQAQWHAEKVRELSEIVEEEMDEGNADKAGFYLVDLMENGDKLDRIIGRLI